MNEKKILLEKVFDEETMRNDFFFLLQLSQRFLKVTFQSRTQLNDEVVHSKCKLSEAQESN